MSGFPERVSVIDVGPRDGLQSEPNWVSSEDKIELINGLIDAGIRHLEVTSFVSPRAVPPSSNYACLPGDSGGPTFRHRSGGGVIALGVIVASGYDLGINRCSWVDMGTALHLSGATIMTHTSLTMAPPTRIAGGDRYATAAAISAATFTRPLR